MPGKRAPHRLPLRDGDRGSYAGGKPERFARDIAGIMNEGRNVLGMMPHPDRSSESILGSADGLRIFQSMVTTLTAKDLKGQRFIRHL